MLGAECYSSIILPGLSNGPKGVPIAQRTKLGWIVIGASKNPTASDRSTANLVMLSSVSEKENLGRNLRRSWELEEVDQKRTTSFEDRQCERLFQQGCRRNVDGSYTVRLPVRNEKIKQVGDRLQGAQPLMSRSQSMMSRDSKLATAYTAFMDEYEQSGHM